MILSNPPNSFPPMKTAGNCSFPCGAVPSLRTVASNWDATLASSFSSTSKTAGLTPRLRSKRLTTWLMQQPLLPTTVTAFSQTMLSTIVSSLGDEEGVVLAVTVSMFLWTWLWECVINGSGVKWVVGLWRGRHDLKGIAWCIGLWWCGVMVKFVVMVGCWKRRVWKN